MRVLVIYDTTGRVWTIIGYDYEECPPGLLSLICTIPEGYHVAGVDVENSEPIFEKDNDEIENLQKSIDTLYEIILMEE